MRPYVIAFLLLTFALPLAAQAPVDVALRRAATLFPGRVQTSTAPLCDGSRVRAAESRHKLGTALLWGGVGSTVLFYGVAYKSGGTTGTTSVISLAGLGSVVAGTLLRRSASGTSDWDATVAQFKKGETRAEDVRSCLGTPSSSTSSGDEQHWTYVGGKQGLFGGSVETLTVNFKAGTFTEVQRSRSNW